VFNLTESNKGDAAFIPLLTEVSHPGLGEKVSELAF